MKGFASDNNSGVHPKILKAIENANTGHAIGYGDDEYTEKAKLEFKRLFHKDVDVYFVFNGTGSNVLSLSTLNRSYHSVICAQSSHINVDECGAPEKFVNCKIIPVFTTDGKLTPELIKPYLTGFGEPHHSQPGIVSISQVTELGTVYNPSEIKAIATLAHDHGMFLHMDGARIANAVASLNIHINDLTIHAGVDVLSFGGTKNGMMFGEAVIFFNPELSAEFKYIRKQGMQLFSKMRFISAQFIEYLGNDLWLENARHSNQMSQYLKTKVNGIAQIQLIQPVESNGLFVRIPREIAEKLQEKYFFYPWNLEKSEYRWMCSFDTTEEDIDLFVEYLKQFIQQEK